MARPVCAPNIDPNDPDCPIRPLTNDGRGFVELDTTVDFRHVGAEEAQLAAPAEQPAREIPILLLELIVARDHLVRHELAGCLVDQAMLLRQSFRSDHRSGYRLAEEPGPAFVDRSGRRCSHWEPLRYILSNIPAAPIPPPTHMVTIP